MTLDSLTMCSCMLFHQMVSMTNVNFPEFVETMLHILTLLFDCPNIIFRLLLFYLGQEHWCRRAKKYVLWSQKRQLFYNCNCTSRSWAFGMFDDAPEPKILFFVSSVQYNQLYIHNSIAIDLLTMPFHDLHIRKLAD